ncbi:MAG: hypothetical protein AAGB46_00010 [Verrucomicrobiota bacterium]
MRWKDWFSLRLKFLGLMLRMPHLHSRARFVEPEDRVLQGIDNVDAYVIEEGDRAAIDSLMSVSGGRLLACLIVSGASLPTELKKTIRAYLEKSVPDLMS